MKKEMVNHSSILAWGIPGMGEPGGLPSMGSQSQTRLKRLSCRSSSLYVSDIRSCEREKYAMREKRNEKETYKDLGFWLIYLVHRKFPPSKLKSVKHRKYAAQLRPHLL